MFQKFLQIVRQGEIQSQLEIAQKLGVSPTMVLEIARELTQRGYLNEFSADCFDQETNCRGCSTSTACQINVVNVVLTMGRTWSLTEKGEKAAPVIN